MAFKDLWTEFRPIEVNDRWVLRQVDPEGDLDVYYEIYCDAEAMKYYQSYGKPPADKDWVRVVLKNQIKEFEKRRVYNWTIADAQTGEAMGRILLSDFQNNNTMANIGYFLHRKHWGKGVATACAEAVIRFGFDYLKLERIYSEVEVNNVASWRVLEKNGFTREGTLRHCFMLNDGIHDCYLYGKLSTDGSAAL